MELIYGQGDKDMSNVKRCTRTTRLKALIIAYIGLHEKLLLHFFLSPPFYSAFSDASSDDRSDKYLGGENVPTDAPNLSTWSPPPDLTPSSSLRTAHGLPHATSLPALCRATYRAVTYNALCSVRGASVEFGCSAAGVDARRKEEFKAIFLL